MNSEDIEAPAGNLRLQVVPEDVVTEFSLGVAGHFSRIEASCLRHTRSKEFEAQLGGSHVVQKFQVTLALLGPGPEVQAGFWHGLGRHFVRRYQIFPRPVEGVAEDFVALQFVAKGRSADAVVVGVEGGVSRCE